MVNVSIGGDCWLIEDYSSSQMVTCPCAHCRLSACLITSLLILSVSEEPGCDCHWTSEIAKCKGGQQCEEDFIFIFLLANDDLLKNKLLPKSCAWSSSLQTDELLGLGFKSKL